MRTIVVVGPATGRPVDGRRQSCKCFATHAIGRTVMAVLLGRSTDKT